MRLIRTTILSAHDVYGSLERRFKIPSFQHYAAVGPLFDKHLLVHTSSARKSFGSLPRNLQRARGLGGRPFVIGHNPSEVALSQDASGRDTADRGLIKAEDSGTGRIAAPPTRTRDAPMQHARDP